MKDSVHSFVSNSGIDGFERLLSQKYNCHWPFANSETHLTLVGSLMISQTKML